MYRILLLLLVLPATALSGTAQELRSPDEFLGQPLGTGFTPYDQVVSYLEHVDRHAPQVVLQQYGTTFQGRPLLAAFVSSPENISRLEQIRLMNQQLVAHGAAEVPDDLPAIVWLSYNVHGNEAVGTESALQTLYDLVNPEHAQAQAWLSNTLVIIDPALNPDGRERYVNWFAQTLGARSNPNPHAREHFEPWPTGRFNHYLYDLNRDWAWQVQKESRHRIALYRRWMPHVHADFHEMGVDQPYYFAPAAEPFHEAVTPWQREFQEMLGENHARYFDADSRLYYTRERFDLLYPSYGDTWPTFNGAIGMTYEQGGSGRAGLAIVTSEGDTLTLARRLRNHRTVGLSTIETASRLQPRLVREFASYFDRARTSPEGRYKTYVIKRTPYRDQFDALLDDLERQGITYGTAPRVIRATGYDYLNGEERPLTITPGDLLISTYQPASVLVGVLFEPQTALADSVTYDITAWSLPYAYGLVAYALTQRIEVAPLTRRGRQSVPAAATARPYAYAIPWKSVADVRFLSALFAAGVQVRSAQVPLRAGDRTFQRGTLLVTRRGNEALGTRLDQVIHDAAARFDREVLPLGSGAVTAGADLGSSHVRLLRKPAVALLAGRNLSPTAVGEVWHFFDHQITYPLTVLDRDHFSTIPLAGYDVLILPDGAYTDVLDPALLEKLEEWVRAGGRLIALQRAAEFLSGIAPFGLVRKSPEDTTHRAQRFTDRQREALSESVVGSIFRVRLDNTHPLAYGYPEHYFTLKTSAAAYEYLHDGWNVGTLEAGSHLSGFVGARAQERLNETLLFGSHSMGSGQIIYLIDNPLFRGFWHNGMLLFGNAVFMNGF